MNKIFKRVSTNDQEYRNLIFDIMSSSKAICDIRDNSAVYPFAIKLLNESCKKMSLFEFDLDSETLNEFRFKNIYQFSCFIHDIVDGLSCSLRSDPLDDNIDPNIDHSINKVICLSRHLVRGKWA